MTAPKKFLACCDIHGDEGDERATDACLSHVKDFNPDIRIIAGDLWNFAAIRAKADEKDRSKSMKSDFEAGKRFADSFFAGGKENHLMLGNHDARAYDLAESVNGTMADHGKEMVSGIKMLARANNAKLWPYDSRRGVLALGHLKVVHGFHTGMSACAAHSRIYGNVIFGHVHSIESYQTPGLKQQEARAIGCLCKLDQPYADRKTAKLRWAHGWAWGFLFPDGSYSIHQAKDVRGKFYAGTEIKAY